MAKDEKSATSPASIQAPKPIALIIGAFHAKSDEVAKSLIFEAIKAIYGKDDVKRTAYSKSELEGALAMVKSIRPRDSLEALFAAQIIVGHLLGMRRLSTAFLEDQRLGLKLLRFSNEAMHMLIRKQTGTLKNVVPDGKKPCLSVA